MGTVATTNAFLTWFAEWGQVVYVGIQMAFWTALAVAALIIALQYKKYVSYKVRDPLKAAGSTRPAPEAGVEAFVE